MEFRLEDQFELYPSQDDEDIQRKLAEKYEFVECKSGRKDRKLPEDEYFTHQRLYQRVGYVYDRLVFIAEAGVGKTRAEICLSEFLKRNDLSSTRSYFLTGNSQKDDFKKQLVYGVEETGLLSEKIKAYSKSAKGLAKTISNVVKKYYEVTSHQVFCSEVRTLIEGLSWEEANEEIRKKYSGIYLFIDEIQFMKITAEQTDKHKKRHDDYWMLWRVIHVIDRARVTIASGRPHTNSIQEFAYAVNLVLPAENQILVDEVFQRAPETFGIEIEYGPDVNWDIAKMRKQGQTMEEMSEYYTEALAPYLNGRVVYVSAPETGVALSYLPLDQPSETEEVRQEIQRERKVQSSLKEKGEVFKSQLRMLAMNLKEDGEYDLQAQTYADFVRRSEAGAKKYFEDTRFREILNFTFPKGEGLTENWGTKGEAYWIRVTPDGRYEYKPSAVPSEPGKDLEWYLKNSLESCSIKMAYCRNQAVNYPGKGYSFFDSVKGGGTNIFGLALEEGGAVMLRDGRSKHAFSKYNPRTHDINYRLVRSLDKVISKRPRYGIITGEVQSASDVANILDLFNHPDNDHGDYMKHIIISKKGQVGINLMSVKYINCFFLSHNPSDIYQAIRRAVRATSHVNLIKESGGKPFEVEINVMVSIFPSSRPFNGAQNTADYSIATRTYTKDLNASCITRAYKRLAVTAWVLDERNTLDPRFDRQPECDYMACELDYPTPEPDGEYDYVNYLLLYSAREIDQEVENILGELRERGTLFVPEFVRERYGTKEPQRSICYLAAASLIEEAREERDVKDMYGFSCIVLEEGGSLYLVRKVSSVPHGPLTSYYTQNLIAVRTRKIEDILEERFQDEAKAALTEAAAYDDDMVGLSVFIGTLKTNVKAVFIEQLIEKLITKTGLPENYENILSIITFEDGNAGNLIIMKEPARALMKITNNHDNRYPIPVEPDADGDLVFVHNVYVFELTKAKAGVTSRATQSIGRLRIRRIGESSWRDTNDANETIAYRTVFQDRIQEIESKIRDHGIYGQVLENNPNNFYIVNKLFEHELTNKTEEHTGRVCHEIGNKIEIVVYMWYMGMRPDTFMKQIFSLAVEKKREALHNYVEKKYKKYINRYAKFPNEIYSFLPVEEDHVKLASDDMTHFFYYYLMSNQSRMPKPALCSELALHMYEKGLVISPTLNKYQILDLLRKQQDNSYDTAKQTRNK